MHITSRYHLRNNVGWFLLNCILSHHTNAVLCRAALQNRTSARSAIPNNQQVFNAYGRYPMLVAAPGQVITMTWPRTAPPDGTAADGSEFLNVYYNPNATINAGKPCVHICLFEYCLI